MFWYCRRNGSYFLFKLLISNIILRGYNIVSTDILIAQNGVNDNEVLTKFPLKNIIGNWKMCASNKEKKGGFSTEKIN